jgi:hypothetical protein
MRELHDYVAALKTIEDHPAPTEDEMKAASDHYATLKAIEEAA